MGREEQGIVRILPLLEKPLKQLLVRQSSDRVRALDRLGEGDSYPGVPAGCLGDGARVDLGDVRVPAPNQLLDQFGRRCVESYNMSVLGLVFTHVVLDC